VHVQEQNNRMLKLLLTWSFVVFLLVNVACGYAVASTNLLAADGWHFGTPQPADATFGQTIDPTSPGGQIQEVTVITPTVPLWLTQFQRSIGVAIPSGDVVRLHFWARSATENPIRVTIESSAPPFQAVAEMMITLTPAWQQYTLDGQSTGFAADEISLHFQCGDQAGDIQIAGATVVDAGLDPDSAAAAKALMPAQIQYRINKYRKGDLIIRVINAAGHPVSGVRVAISQTRHAFLFGCNIFNLNPSDTSPQQIAYQNEFAALFNYATLPFYWGSFEEHMGSPDYQRLQEMADWCIAHNITPKGHPLVWHQVWPSWAPATADQSIPLLKARVSDLITHYHATIHYWDVVNEANSAADCVPPNGESAWVQRDGPAEVVSTALGWARDAGQGLPDTFLYNDFNVDDQNIALLSNLQARGSLPDAIGIQSHMHAGVWPLAKVWDVCQKFSRFGRPIHFTEITVLSGPVRTTDPSGANASDWNTTASDEAAQADYVAKFYAVLFSHPSVRAITWWDFSDLNAWMGAPAGLVRKDMSVKPAYTRLVDLIHKQWWTNITSETDSDGICRGRVYYGDYIVSLSDKYGREKSINIVFPEAAPPKSVVISWP
jgi:endo-1,4-beta-xylanase